MQNTETYLSQSFQPQPAHISSQTQRHKGALHLTHAELGERRRKGLCFEYGQPFSPQHRCPEGQFRVILLNDVEKLDEAGEKKICKAAEEDGNLSPAEGECQILSNMSLTALDTRGTKTLKLGREAAAYINGTFIKPIKLEFDKDYYPYLLKRLHGRKD